MSKRFFINPLLFAMCTAGFCTLSTPTTAFGADPVPVGNVSQVQNTGIKSTSIGEVNASAKRTFWVGQSAGQHRWQAEQKENIQIHPIPGGTRKA